LRINPYEWNDEDYVCTKLEVYGCQLQGITIFHSTTIPKIVSACVA